MSNAVFFLFGGFVAAILVLGLVCFLLRTEGSNGYPGVTQYPLVGALVTLMRVRNNLQAFSMMIVQQHNYKTLCITSPGRRVYVSSTPADVAVILGDVRAFVKGPRFRTIFYDLLGDGIFNADHALWESQRKAASHLFAATRLREFQQDVFERDAEHLLSLLRQKADDTDEPIDLQNLLYALTFDSFCALAFGESFGAVQLTFDHSENAKPPFLHAFDEAVRLVTSRFVTPPPLTALARFLRVGQEGELARHIALIDSVVYGIVDKVLLLSADELESRKDLLGLYAQHARKHDAALLDRQFLRCVVVNFLLAGRDTTASTLTSFFRIMCHHPEHLARIEAEVARGSQRHDFLDACLQETLRLFPPVLNNTKVYVGDTPLTLPSGPTIVKGDIASWRIGGVQRNPQFWSRAQEFVPQRWIEKDATKDAIFAQPSEQHQFFMPAFNGGRRLCLGKSMALIEARTCVCTLVRGGVGFELVDKNDDLANWSAFTSTAVIALKAGLKVRVARRRH